MAQAIDPRWAWDRYQPSAKSPWDVKKVGHLYRRAAFGATAAELEAGLKAGPHQTIDHLLQSGGGQEEFDRRMAPLAESIARSNSGNQARSWWLYRMMYTPHPLHEKLTLFWHNHFATSNRKVQNAGYMLGQYALLHRHALGNFRTLLQEISKDPAMMVWLDTIQSRKGKPNENYARELMELFSLGIGTPEKPNYTETDIRQAARAFTGWTIQAGKTAFQPGRHDDGVKTVLGKTGPFMGADIVNLCLEQKASPYFIAGKLFRFLVSETIAPTAELLEPLAVQFRKSDYHFGALVETVLRSNLFFSPLVYRTRVKSPVDFALGIVRALEGRIGTLALAAALEDLGQNVFHPPTVKGWDGGPAWLNGQTLLFRQNLALALTSTEDTRHGRRADPAALVRKYSKKGDVERVDFLLRLFLQGDVPAESRGELLHYMADAHKQVVPVYWTPEDADNHCVRALCHLVLTLPEFQLD
jgi:uncharacterized protein (DUF1800 family)